MPVAVPRITSFGRISSHKSFLIGSAFSIVFGAFAHAKAQTPTGQPIAPQHPSVRSASGPVVKQCGIASWYGKHWQGRRTASGTRFDDRKFTAANLWMPFSTRARVTNLANGRSVVVTVNDRGPYAKGRMIDLSAGAAKALGMLKAGLAEVSISAELAPARLYTR